MRDGVRLCRRETALVVVDVQERLFVFQFLRQVDTDGFRALAPLLK